MCVVHSMLAHVRGTWYTNVAARVLEDLFLVLALPLRPCGLEGVIPPTPLPWLSGLQFPHLQSLLLEHSVLNKAIAMSPDREHTFYKPQSKYRTTDAFLSQEVGKC